MREIFMRTARIGFSTWMEGDEQLALALWGDERVTHFLSADGRFSREEALARLDRERGNQEEYGMQYWPLFALDDGAFVGCCGLRPYGEGVYEIGFHLLPAYWGKGLGEEAARAVILYAFESLGAKGLFAGHHPDNVGSAHLLKKLGFQYDNDVFYEPTGRMHPSYCYGALEENGS